MSADQEIWCLDVASKMGVAEGVPRATPRLYTQRFARAGDEPEDVFGRAALWIAERLVISTPMAVYIEAPIGAGSWGNTTAKTTDLLIGLWAVISGIVRARGVPCHRARVNTVRAHFIGQGNLPGEQGKRECMRVCRSLGWEPKDYDESDAAAMWSWAASLHDKGLFAPREHWAPRERA